MRAKRRARQGENCLIRHRPENLWGKVPIAKAKQRAVREPGISVLNYVIFALICGPRLSAGGFYTWCLLTALAGCLTACLIQKLSHGVQDPWGLQAFFSSTLFSSPLPFSYFTQLTINTLCTWVCSRYILLKRQFLSPPRDKLHSLIRFKKKSLNWIQKKGILFDKRKTA